MDKPLDLLIDRLATPIGELIVIADRDGCLRTIDWTDHEARMKQLLDRHYGKGRYTLTPRRDPGGLSSAMRRYFKGEIGVLKELAVATAGTPFQQSVWKALRRIKDGTTISYAELARRIGRPRAVRAAGLAALARLRRATPEDCESWLSLLASSSTAWPPRSAS